MTETAQAAAAPPEQRPTSDSAPEASQPRGFRHQVLGIAGYVGALRRGPRAVLRRLDAGDGTIPPQDFWNVVERYGIAERDERLWLAVLPLMVRYPHRFDRSPGRALAAAGVSASRVERWLRLDSAAARREAGRLLSHLKGEGLDWIKLAYLLRDWSDEQRRGFARDFFLSPEYRQRQTKGDS
jgi:CRISPR type I-E-associated protein CasB/Cse2